MQPSAVEARHFAAAYTLFRVCSMRNLHMMLPPAYRDLWKGDFTNLKVEDDKECKGWMYEADPFLGHLDRQEAQRARAKLVDSKPLLKAMTLEQRVGLELRNVGGGRSHMRGWTNMPKVDLGKRARADIEDIIRRKVIWNSPGLTLSETQRRNIIHELETLGFRSSHVDEATLACKDRAEVLEWLLIHVPEDDMPKWALPEGYMAGVSMASGNIKRDLVVKRLAETGYSADLCKKLLDENQGDENQTAEALQSMLVLGLKVSTNQLALDVFQSFPTSSAASDAIWAEEQETLNSIYGHRHSITSKFMCQIELDCPDLESPLILIVRKSKAYPTITPSMSIASSNLPSYILLSIYRQAIEYANANLLNQSMIFNLVDWMEGEIPRIIQNPGKLTDVSAAASMMIEPTSPVLRNPKRVPKNPVQTNWSSRRSESLSLLSRWQLKRETPQQRSMLTARQKLPAWDSRHIIVDTVNKNQVTIICGETGSGKSTQSVQFILDDMIQRQLGSAANIICTQPRRISAISLADRVSDERCSILGDEVGYVIKGESKQRQGVTKITFMTTGVLLRRLQASSNDIDGLSTTLSDVSHIVIDEVHERSLDTDFLLILLRSILAKRKDLKVILMSATLDAKIFEGYFCNTSSVGKIEIPGRTFPIDDYYLDDIALMTGFGASSDSRDDKYTEVSLASTIQGIGMRINYSLIAAAVTTIDAQLGLVEGGILIFLPGVMEISRTIDAIRSIPNIHVLPLHASLTSMEQRRVFPPAPRGKRKVIIATNVAETSITIEDIVAVIDTGRVKETSFDPQNNIVKLEEVWASRAACKQRRGRAGRLRPGKCYKLFTRNAETKMAERSEPEMIRVPLEQLCLSVRAMGIEDVAAFLESSLTPPKGLAIEGAMKLLYRMGALDGDELSALGRHLSTLPTDLRCGKLMIYGITFGCFESCLTIAAILTVKSPFSSPQTKREDSKKARLAFAPAGQGDLLTDLAAYDKWVELRSNSSYHDLREWCNQNFLSHQTLSDIASNRMQYLSALKEAAFIARSYTSPHNIASSTSQTRLNTHTSSTALLRALIAGAFNPQLTRIEFPSTKFAASHAGAVALDSDAKTIKYFTEDASRVFIHPSSTLFGAQSFPGNNCRYISYFTKISTSKVFIRDCTPCNAFAVLLLGGPVVVDTSGRGLMVDGWIRMRGWARIGALVGRLRRMLDDVLARRFETMNDHDGVAGLNDAETEEVVAIVRRLVELDGMDS